MKPVIAITIEHYESLLKRATENPPLYFRLKNAVKMANTIIIRCDPDQAEMLLQLATDLCPDAAADSTSDQIDVRSKGNDYDRGERATRTITRRRSVGVSG
jgi:hypothetical protein